MEKNVKRVDFVRLRINSIEKERLLNVEKLTGRKKSDILREAIYKFIKDDYPQFLN
jgi:predicted DNA-binding protein